MNPALRQVIPFWITTAAELVKASTLLSIIGVSELLLVTQEVISRNYLSLEIYGFVVERFGDKPRHFGGKAGKGEVQLSVEDPPLQICRGAIDNSMRTSC